MSLNLLLKWIWLHPNGLLKIRMSESPSRREREREREREMVAVVKQCPIKLWCTLWSVNKQTCSYVYLYLIYLSIFIDLLSKSDLNNDKDQSSFHLLAYTTLSSHSSSFPSTSFSTFSSSQFPLLFTSVKQHLHNFFVSQDGTCFYY